jgi:nitroimidazol reductase NimA-like FMN-containing flavoprotein (pyridoxamine 5'-phosphate oxidase superfamily)
MDIADVQPVHSGPALLLEDQGLEVLADDECRELLKIGRIGRVVVTVGAVSVIMPVNYSLLDGDVVFRTAGGTKLDAAARNAVVSFEVDRIDAVFEEGWSVIVVGPAEEVHDARALERVRALDLRPWAEGTRDHVVRIRPEFLSGRRIVHAPRRERAPDPTGDP